MTPELVASAALAAAFATAPFALYFGCVRPSLRWLRAQWHAHAAVAALSLVPAAALALGNGSRTLSLLGGAATLAVVGAWMFPRWIVRRTGGPAPATGEVGEVLGYVVPAGRFLDLGDLRGAQLQVNQARKRATEATLEYVELWDEVIRDERKRRRGQRISRTERFEAISEAYGRLVCGSDPIRTAHAVASIVVVAVAAMGGLLVQTLS